MGKIPTYEELDEIAAILTEKDFIPVEVIINIGNQEWLNKLNDEFYYRSARVNPGIGEKIEEPSEVTLNIGNIKYKFII